MANGIKEDYITELIQRDMPMQVKRIELGGGYYYKCHWISCNADVKRFDNFCPQCGQRLSFD